MPLHIVPLTPSKLRLLSAIIIAVIAALISACGDSTGPRITDMQSRSAAVPGECVQRAFGSVDGGQPSNTSSTAGSCEPYDCREGWFGHIECDPYDCTMYPTTCLSDGGGGGGGGDSGGGGNGATCSAGYQYSNGACTPIPCDPIADPQCERQLNSLEKQLVADALGYVRDFTQIADSAAQERCYEMVSSLSILLFMNKLYAGTYSSPPPDGHEAAFNPLTGNVHIEPTSFTAAASSAAGKWQLANTLLHEAAHRIDRDHPSGGVPTPWGRLYQEDYFKELSPGPNSCLVAYPGSP